MPLTQATDNVLAFDFCALVQRRACLERPSARVVRCECLPPLTARPCREKAATEREHDQGREEAVIKYSGSRRQHGAIVRCPYMMAEFRGPTRRRRTKWSPPARLSSVATTRTCDAVAVLPAL